jgi:hypothetical protein
MLLLLLLLLLLLQEIKITGATIFTNPFQEMEEEQKQQQAAEQKKVGKFIACAASLNPLQPEQILWLLCSFPVLVLAISRVCLKQLYCTHQCTFGTNEACVSCLRSGALRTPTHFMLVLPVVLIAAAAVGKRRAAG